MIRHALLKAAMNLAWFGETNFFLYNNRRCLYLSIKSRLADFYLKNRALVFKICLADNCETEFVLKIAEKGRVKRGGGSYS